MDKMDEMGQTTDKEIQKMKKKEELKQQLEKAKEQGKKEIESM
ncbi:MAG TPA: hypothetical protein VN031_03285 [Candidatus Microsaccharimonas sp.]|nr:hypothetical protein [Candidatus Microsaccharimonas sp.]